MPTRKKVWECVSEHIADPVPGELFPSVASRQDPEWSSPWKEGREKEIASLAALESLVESVPMVGSMCVSAFHVLLKMKMMFFMISDSPIHFFLLKSMLSWCWRKNFTSFGSVLPES